MVRVRPGMPLVYALLLAAAIGGGCAVLRRDKPAPLRVGVRHFPPFYYAEPDKPVRGISVEVVSEAAKRLGLELEWVTVSGSSVEALRRGAIDLWPTLTCTTDKDTSVYLTEPWLSSEYFLLFRENTGIDETGDVGGRKVAYVPSVVQRQLAHKYLGHSILVEEMTPAACLEDLCSGKTDAAFLEARDGQSLLLHRPRGCEDVPLRFRRVEGAKVPLGIASTPAAASAADRLRAEIGRMAEDGALDRITGRWSFATSAETSALYALREARQRMRWTILGSLVLAAALALSIWQIIRVRQARRVAEEASASIRRHALEQERYRLLFERSLAGLFRTSTDGQIVDCNDAFARMLGYQSREEVLPRTAWEFYAEPEVRQAYLERLEQEKMLTNYELSVRRRDGSTGWFLANVSLLPSTDGRMRYLEGSVVDITRIRELEQQYRQAQKLESVGRLAGGVAHDFNNLLTAINGYSELVLSQLPEGEHLREFVHEIRKAGDRAAALTQQLLAFSRKQLLQPEILDLNRVVEDIEKMLRRLIGEDISLVVVLAPDLANVRADPGQIQQVIMNLAVNARDAMPFGGELVLETSNAVLDAADSGGDPDFRPGAYVRLSVRDTGVGMHEGTLRHLFEPFFTTKGQGKGTGLGLSTVYGIIKQSDGLIRVQSQPGKGTAFAVYLPQANGAETPLASNVRDSLQNGSGTILVVEDQEQVRQLAVKVLSRSGYTVLEAGSGDEALETVRAKPGEIELLITDVVMPGIPGRVLADRVQALSPGIRVLFMSGYSDDTVVQQGVIEKGVDYLQKPFSPQQLTTRVRQTLSRGGSGTASCRG